MLFVLLVPNHTVDTVNMVKSGKTAQEFIQYSFSPLISVLSSPKVNNVVSKNNLSFVELLQPFSLLDWEGQFREPTGSFCTVRNLKLNIRDINWKPLQPTEARKQLNNAVILNYHDKTIPCHLGKHKFDIPQSTIWFDAWRETYFEVQFPSDHEYTKHFLACMLVATTQDENIIDTFNGLLQQLNVLQNVTPPKLPKWFNNQILKSYVLLHDPAIGNKEKVQSMFEMMQQTFGSHNCFLLTINSRNYAETDRDPVTTDLWTPYIKRSDTISSEMFSAQTNLPSPEAGYYSPNATTPASTQEDFTTLVPLEGHHPLTPIENDIYDNANSLQTNSLSGSVESVGIDRRVLDSSNETHGNALSMADVDALKQFLKDFSSKALLPYFERQISLLSDVVANRKGVSRSLLSATKRWFGTGKSGTTTANNVIYSNDCPELQLRRLGDLWFMAGQWQRAFDTYHTAKREFYADSAWLCYAGALEMAAISAFMAGEPSRKTYGYIEESITTYLNTCRMVQYAVRATLLSVLCLTNAGLYGEAAKQLIRMTSEDSDLRSAMLLEQASLSFLSGPSARGMVRKYAFHMVLAGHRFSKAGQKKHAYRCYQQAYQVYKDSGWRLSSDHVQYSLGRLAGSLKNTRDAVLWLSGPLVPASPQPATQQHSFLREYMLAYQQLIDVTGTKSELKALPLPLVVGTNTSVLIAGTSPLAAPRRLPATSLAINNTYVDQKHWHKMEQMLLQVAQGSLPMIFKPTVNLYTKDTDNSSNPTVPQGEPVQISINIINPLKITLTMLDIELLWQFHPMSIEENRESLQNEPAIAASVPLKSDVISGQKIKSFTLEGDSQKNIVFSITPLQVGELHLRGLSYKLSNSNGNEEHGGGSTVIFGKQVLEITKTGANKDETLKDKRLQIKVIPCSPCLQMTFSEIVTEVISGELLTVDVEFRNVGPVDMRNLCLAVSHPECVSIVTLDTEEDDFKLLYEEKYKTMPENLDERTIRAAVWRSLCSRHVATIVPCVVSGATVRRSLLIRPSHAAPQLHLLAYYDAEGCPHRLLRHTFQFNVADIVKVVSTPRRYIKINGDNTSSETMSLSVDVQNDGEIKDLTTSLEILEASLLSRQWEFIDFIVSKDKSDALILHEKMHLILRAKRITDHLVDGKVLCSSLKINQKHPESLPNINKPPFSKFVLDYKSSLNDDFDVAPYGKINKSAGLIQSTLIIRWKMQVQYKEETRTALGQSYIWLDCFTCTRTSDSLNANLRNEMLSTLNFEENDDDLLVGKKTSQKKEDIVVFRMEHTDNVDHCFQKRKLCVVPVTIHFVNCYGVPVKAFMNMSTKRTGAEVGWAGGLSSGPTGDGVSVELEAFESRHMSLNALLAAPGTYLLGADAKITCEIQNSDPVIQHCNNSSVLVVKDIACI